MKPYLLAPTLLVFLLTIYGCVIPAPGSRPWLLDQSTELSTQEIPIALQDVFPTPRNSGSPYFTPTPDDPHFLPDLRSEAEMYLVQSGDTLDLIASRYHLSVDSLIMANPGINANWLEIGQTLHIPFPRPSAAPSDFKIIPDSELVYGPVSSTLDIAAFISQQNGYLQNYTESVGDQSLSGAQIILRVAYEYSVNPRLLLSFLEFQSGWVSRSNPDANFQNYPIAFIDENRQGLYKQLAWTADSLNSAYYLWKTNRLSYAILEDGNLVLLSPTINAGTAAVQYTLARLSTVEEYSGAVSANGLFSVYQNYFGTPFDLAIEGLLPANLTQPELILPFEKGSTWSFTGGPHGGWGVGSAWAAIDFAPPGESFGCFSSNAWVRASADGLIVRAKDGAVVQDLDGDGLEQTGWTLLYMHVESRDRVSAGSYLKAGDPIGHPSCEGGVSNGTHLHFARRYNGEWIPADGNLPFNLNGWQSVGNGIEYDGTLTLNGQIVTAWDGRIAENQIQH
ncbi:MAG: LysM peptidoglycan-binding domain-containing M23 family metallopeptidase [Chloroflexi bacterium]|nr:LysM peptidoglycan-binding domain-containing M23 family metallopeptidase [Chloroflexota bacterium]